MKLNGNDEGSGLGVWKRGLGKGGGMRTGGSWVRILAAANIFSFFFLLS